MEKELNVVGTRLPMLDAAQKAKGTAQFTDDLFLPGMLYGKILRSPFAHARILNIDTSKAEKLPGVKGVITGRDIPDRQYGIVPMAKDEYALAKEKVRYIGDDVAAVCAIDPEIAEEAIELIKVDYEELPAVFDPLEAKKEGAPEIHQGVKNNTSFAIHKEFGDVKRAFAECDAVFEDSFYSQAVNHAPLEPHAALAQFQSRWRIRPKNRSFCQGFLCCLVRDSPWETDKVCLRAGRGLCLHPAAASDVYNR